MYDVQRLCDLPSVEQAEQMRAWIRELISAPEQQRQQAIRRLVGAIDALDEAKCRDVHQVEMRILLELEKDDVKTYIRSRRWALQAAASEVQAIFLEQMRQSTPEVQQKALSALRELTAAAQERGPRAGRGRRIAGVRRLTAESGTPPSTGAPQA